MACYEAILLLLASVCIASGQSEGAVRLADGDISSCGRVEVFHDGEWGTVCDDRWSSVDGDVVCKQLGYSGAQTAYHVARFGEGTGPIWMDSIDCSAEDGSISDCGHNGWGVHDCTHAEDAGVCCKRKTAPKPQTLPVRLSCPECKSGGSITCKACPNKRHPSTSDCLPQVAVRAIVEVEVDGKWGPISADGWGVNEASVVCGQLGYPMAYPYGHPPPSVGDMWPDYSSDVHSEAQCLQASIEQTNNLSASLANTNLQGVECSGKETSLLECYFSGVGSQPNPSRVVATVQCGFFPHINCYSSVSEVCLEQRYSVCLYMLACIYVLTRREGVTLA